MLLKSGILLCSFIISAGNSATYAASYTSLHSFGAVDGDYPVAGLINAGGILYGTTEGIFDPGTVFSLDPQTGEVKEIYAFQGETDGANPRAGLLSVGTLLYGSTIGGGGSANCGSMGCGIIFSIDPSTGTETILHRFQNGTDGAYPLSGLTSVGGEIFGTTEEGGGDGGGTVFSLKLKNNKEKIVHVFTGYSDGEFPVGGLITLGGKLYGTASQGGGASFGGTVFSIGITSKAFDIVYSFQGYPDAAGPSTNLLNVGGMLYGIATTSADGMIFKVDPSTGTETIVYSFQGGRDGTGPSGSLIKVGGLLYGMTGSGGATSKNCPNGCGTVFSFNPATGKKKILHSFGKGADGIGPNGGLLNLSGTLFGTTRYGGSYNEGTIFEIKP